VECERWGLPGGYIQISNSNNLLYESFGVDKENSIIKKEEAKSTVLDLNVELDYFLNREVSWKNRLLRYEQLITIFFEAIKKIGLSIKGPICTPKYDNYQIRYSVTGTDDKGKIWDSNADFEVNSRKDYFKPISELAKTLNSLIDKE